MKPRTERLEQEARTEPRSPWWTGLTGLAIAATTASTVLTLMGYGAVRAYDSMFGFSYPLWFETPLDLLAMSGDAVMGLLHGSLSDFGGLALWRGAGFTASVLAAAVLVWRTVQWFRNSPRTSGWRERGQAKVEACIAWFFKPQATLTGHLAQASVTATTVALIGGAVHITATVLLTLALAAVGFIPLLGYLGTSAYVKAAIIDPPSCVSPVGVRMRVKSTRVGAECVEVTDPATGKTVSGRLILARGSRVFLYSKEQDRAFMLTIKDASLANLHEEPRPTEVSTRSSSAQE